MGKLNDKVWLARCITLIAEQMEDIEAWLNENAPEVFDDQRHLDEGSEARKYWHYGRFIALRDVMRWLIVRFR
tara:strand:- start:274 stop:492 length:219 start_codon:yes stop_codon:yes gene_type:complete